MKHGGRWAFIDNSGVPLPSTLDANGYPTSISNGGVYSTVSIPSQAERPGNWKVRWTGEGTISTVSMGGGSVITGSKSGVNGSFTMRPTTTTAIIGISSINVANPITNIEFYYEEDEAALDAGQMFTPRFKELLASAGVIRFLNWQGINGSMVAKWADRRSIDNVVWLSGELRASRFRGTTTNSGNDYTIDLGDGGSPSDKDGHLIRFNADATGGDCTLNGLPIFNRAIQGPTSPAARLFSEQYPLADRQAYVVYDDDLGGWIKDGGGSENPWAGIGNGAPLEVMLALCNEVGAHPWLHVPHMAMDPPTDFATELAAAVKVYTDANAPWMVPRYEPSNEVWNFGNAFPQTRYGWAKAKERWGFDFDHHSWYGRVASLAGEAISDVYGDDRSKYQMVAGVQTFSGGTSGSNSRLGGRHVSIDGGTPASDWVTHIAMANYISPALYGTGTEGTMATAYASADADGKAALAAEYAASVLDPVSGSFTVPKVAQRVTDWKAFADGFGLGLTFYEGGYSPDFGGNATIDALRDASKDAPLLEDYLRTLYSDCLRRGGEFPAVYRLTGTDAWGVWESIYQAGVPPQWVTIAEFARTATPRRTMFRFSAA